MERELQSLRQENSALKYTNEKLTGDKHTVEQSLREAQRDKEVMQDRCEDQQKQINDLNDLVSFLFTLQTELTLNGPIRIQMKIII